MVATTADFATNLKLKLRSDEPLVLPGYDMSAAEFYTFCIENPDLRIERNAQGQIMIMAPTTSETGKQNATISGELYVWRRSNPIGEVFDSSTGFTLPNGAVRAPDASWISAERWQSLAPEQKQKFAPIVPDFVLELRSADQSLPELKAKMEEYIACGARLGWLVDPAKRCTLVFSAVGEPEMVLFEQVLSGKEVLPGFELRMADIFKV
ncbi:MAG: Uma2 family endonuclease [Bacteroidota bacterium]